MTAGPSVAVVVPTKNSGRTLAACLRSVVDQTAPASEIVVVDNGSEDDTVAIARASGARIAVAGPERSAQRNHGWRHTSADAVFFVDSDMVLEPTVLAEARSILGRDDAVGALVVPERAFGTGFLSRCRALEKEMYLANPAVEAARIFRRDALTAVGGYDEALTACEDWDLADRVTAAGWGTARTSAQVWHDEGRVRLRACFAKKRYYGAWYRHYLATRTGLVPARMTRGRVGAAQVALAGRAPLRAAGLLALKATEVAGFAVGAVERRAAPPT